MWQLGLNFSLNIIHCRVFKAKTFSYNQFNFLLSYHYLLSVQIVYKLLSPIMVGTLTNPVIISNLFIALFHSYSVFKIVLNEKINL
jgi:hypothetical protein